MIDHPYTLTNGIQGLPKLVLSSKDEARAEIYLHGAHVTSWIPAGGEERLFLSRTSEFGPGAAIRGGVPVIFPQFGTKGPLPKHGFVRRMDWELVKVMNDQSGVTAHLALRDNEASRQLWPHAFNAEMAVTVGGKQLEMTLTVHNTDQEPFSFTASLHTYLRVADIHRTWTEGLGGLHYMDTVGEWAERLQQEDRLTFQGEVDRIYLNAPAKVELHEPGRMVAVETRGFPDVVIWNPWEKLNSSLTDLEPGGYQHLACMEAVLTGEPLILQPGERWSGTQRLTA